MTIQETTQHLKTDLQSLRDEIRLQIHLGEMDVKDEWSKLEPEVEAAIKDAAHDASDMVHILVAKLTGLRKRLG